MSGADVLLAYYAKIVSRANCGIVDERDPLTHGFLVR